MEEQTTLLDLLLSYCRIENGFSDKDVRDEVNTFILAVSLFINF